MRALLQLAIHLRLARLVQQVVPRCVRNSAASNDCDGVRIVVADLDLTTLHAPPCVAIRFSADALNRP